MLRPLHDPHSYWTLTKMTPRKHPAMQTALPSKRAKIGNLFYRSTLFLVVCAGTIACGGDEPGPTPTVYEPLGSDISLESVDLSTTELAPGERLTVVASLINRGDRSGE